MKQLDDCIAKLIRLEQIDEPKSWRDLTEHEISNDIFALGRTIEFAENEMSNVIQEWSKKMINSILRDMKDNIEQGGDIVDSGCCLEVIKKAAKDIALMISKTYKEGHKSIDKKDDVDDDWLSDWSYRRAYSIAVKMDADLTYKIVTDMLDGELPK